MARASRSASAKPAEKKDAKEVKVNGAGTSRPPKEIRPPLTNLAVPRRGAKKTEDAPVANGIAEEVEDAEDVEMADEDAEEVKAAPQKRKVNASKVGLSAKTGLATGRSRAKKTETPAPEPKAAPKKTTKRKKDEESEPEVEDAPAPAVKKPKVERAKAAPKAAPKAASKAATPEPEPEAEKIDPALVPNPKGPRRAKGKKT